MDRLYKIHDHPDCINLLKIVRYLFALGIDVRPKQVIERNFPPNICIVPTVIHNNKQISGGLNVYTYYENV